MEDKCISCGLPVSDKPDWYRTCDGEVYDAPDPYAEEIHDDHEDV